MASPQISAIADNQSPIASVKRPRSQVLSGAQPYGQIFSIDTSEPAESKDDSFEAYYKMTPKSEGRASEGSASSVHEELFSPQLTVLDDEGSEDEGKQGAKNSPRKVEIKTDQCKEKNIINSNSEDSVEILTPQNLPARKDSNLKRTESAQSIKTLSSTSSLGEPELEPDDIEETISLEEEEEASARAPPPEQEFNPYLFMKRLPPYEQQVTAAYRRRRLLPPQKNPPLSLQRRERQKDKKKTFTSRGYDSGASTRAIQGRSGATRREQQRRGPGTDRNGAATSRSPCSAPTLLKRPTLVLDLDETLVHCTVQPTEAADIVFPVLFNGVNYQVHVHKRPHLDKFLSRVRELYEVVVFTASQKVYADALLNILDPNHDYIEHRLFRDDCLEVERNFLKDLQILGRDLSRVILVDNSPYAYGYQIDNGVPIISWFDDDEDAELLKLLPFLETLAKVKDVRPIIRKQFQTHLLIKNA